MTDPAPYLNTQIAPDILPKIDPTFSPTRSTPPLLGAPLQATEPHEDDSTIKCICGFKHDDGSSVLCDRCDTWQHTQCYYYDEENDRVPPKDELDAITHFCTDCESKPIDVQAAIGRQRARIFDYDQDDRKIKKPASKSHKKKSKTTETNGILANGWSPDADGSHERTSRSPRDPPLSVKKSKSSHRPSHSVNLPALSQHTTSHPHKRSGTIAQSPSKPFSRHFANGFFKEQYSEEFLRLYDEDPGEQSLRMNLLSNINISDDLSAWAYDVEALKNATRGFSHADVFHRIDQPLENLIGPPPMKKYKEQTAVTTNGRHPRWIYLTSDGFTKQNSIVGELKGKIGHMRDYISDPENRWDWLRHPAPFVFFHPRLPIYIDTRSEGTICRYLRRSCRPNLSMTTFLEDNSEYHFCFTAKEDIEPGAEMSIGWVLDEHMRKFSSNKNDMAQDLSPDGEEYFTDWVGKVSPEFGGCACGQPESCWFVRYDPENKALSRPKSGSSKRRLQSHVQDASDGEDARSTSRSESGSRAMTPTGSNAHAAGFGMEISDREKRKIAALERNFEQLENDKHQPATKKKKRNSGGSNTNTPGPIGPMSPRMEYANQRNADQSKSRPLVSSTTSQSQPNSLGLGPKPQYVDASTSRRKSGSPTARGPNGFSRPRNNIAPELKTRSSQTNTPTIPSPLSRPNYVSVAIQTDPNDEDDWPKPCAAPRRPRKPFISLTKRLLLKSQYDRQKLEERRNPSLPTSQTSPGIESGEAVSKMNISHTEEDVPMHDANTSSDPPQHVQLSTSTSNAASTPVSAELKPPLRLSDGPHPANSNGDSLESRGQNFSKLQQSHDVSTGTPPTGRSTPPIPTASHIPANSSGSLPPFPSAVNPAQPSPAKKISLSDYIKRKGSHSTSLKAAQASPELPHNSLRPPLPPSNGDAPMEGSALVETPKKEDANPLESMPAEGHVKTASPASEYNPPEA